MAIDHHHVLPKDYLARERLETSLLFPPDLFADFFSQPYFFLFLPEPLLSQIKCIGPNIDKMMVAMVASSSLLCYS